MTASIVGWAAYTIWASSIRRRSRAWWSGRQRSASDAAFRWRFDEIVLGHFNAGFLAADFTAALVAAGDPNLRFKPASASKTPAPPDRPPCIRAGQGDRRGGAKIVLVVGSSR